MRNTYPTIIRTNLEPSAAVLGVRLIPASSGNTGGTLTGKTSMGPIVLFDKSFLEGLNPDEAVWFDHFFLANVCPMFYLETQSDLAKEGSDRGTPEELVRKLANKFPDLSGSPNVHHATMCTANLLGEDVPLRAQVILPPGCQATVAGRTMAILPESREAKSFLRWTQGEYQEEERGLCLDWQLAQSGSEKLHSRDRGRFQEGFRQRKKQRRQRTQGFARQGARVINPGKPGYPSESGRRKRMGRDLNPRYGYPYAGFQNRCLKPLGHPSVAVLACQIELGRSQFDGDNC